VKHLQDDGLAVKPPTRAQRDLEAFLVRYFEKHIRARIWWGSGRPFIPVVLYEDDAGDKRTTELFLDDLARAILEETGRQ
jgi:hypothetical protein